MATDNAAASANSPKKSRNTSQMTPAMTVASSVPRAKQRKAKIGMNEQAVKVEKATNLSGLVIAYCPNFFAQSCLVGVGSIHGEAP